MFLPAPMQMLIGFSVCVIVGFSWKYFWASRRPANFPPGPPTRPFVGNLHQLPKSKAFLKYHDPAIKFCHFFHLTISRFHEWSHTYGSIVGLKFGPQNVVVLNSWKHVRE
jgi:hypothetical protein